MNEASLTERTGCLVVGLKEVEELDYRYHPEETSVLEPNSTLMLLGDRQSLRKARRILEVDG